MSDIPALIAIVALTLFTLALILEKGPYDDD